jgi:hypothetical protein
VSNIAHIANVNAKAVFPRVRALPGARLDAAAVSLRGMGGGSVLQYKLEAKRFHFQVPIEPLRKVDQ